MTANLYIHPPFNNPIENKKSEQLEISSLLIPSGVEFSVYYSIVSNDFLIVLTHFTKEFL